MDGEPFPSTTHPTLLHKTIPNKGCNLTSQLNPILDVNPQIGVTRT
jgi:hypothetical protein